MYAIEDAEKTRLLLDRGADINARSGEGRTALLIAVGRAGSNAVVKLLLERGASASVRLPDGRGALQLGVAARDAALLSMLLEHGAGKAPLPLGAALLAGCTPCFELLLKLAEPGDLNAALTAAVRLGDLPSQECCSIGVHNPSPTFCKPWPSPQTTIPVDAIQTLIAAGADINAKTAGGTILEFANRHGNATLVDALHRAGVKDEISVPAVLKSRPSSSVRGALERSLPLLQRADVAFIQKAGCVSCHNNSLTAMTIAAARAKGVKVNEHIASAQLKRIAAFLEENRERALENVGLPGGIDTVSYILLGMAAEKYPSDPLTDVWARYVKNNQSPDGRWQCASLRPPLESSDFQVTAASIRSVLHVRSQKPAERVRQGRRARGSLARTGPTDQHGGSCFQDPRVDLGRGKPSGDPKDC